MCFCLHTGITINTLVLVQINQPYSEYFESTT